MLGIGDRSKILDFLQSVIIGDKKTSITPNLDKLLENGVYFSQAVSSAPASLPAVSSILTGLYPFTTLSLEGKVYNLKRDIPTIGQKLETNGYKNFNIDEFGSYFWI